MPEVVTTIETGLMHILMGVGVVLCVVLALLSARWAWAAFGKQVFAAWRALAPRARAAVLLVLAAFTIYGGGKTNILDRIGGEGLLRIIPLPPEGAGGAFALGDGRGGSAPLPSATGRAAFSNLCFTAIDATPTNVALGIGWLALTNTMETLDIYAKTNLLESHWRHLAEMNADAIDEGAAADVPLEWLDYPASAFFNLGDRSDEDGDGLPDAFETLAVGSDPSLVDTDGDGLGDFTEYLAGLDPRTEPQGFAAQSDSLAALELVPPFSAEFPESFADSNVWQRTIHVEPLDGLRQYFISGSPDGTTQPDFGGMTLEWDDGHAHGVVPTNTPAFPLPLEGHGDRDLTLTLRRDGAAVFMDSQLYLLSFVPRISLDAAVLAGTNGVVCYVADFSATRHVDIEVDCSGNPGTNRTVRSFFDGLAQFFWESGIEVGQPDSGESLDDETCSLPLIVSSLGVHPLPSPVPAAPVAALRAGGPPDPGESPVILAIAPFIEWSGDHDKSARGDRLRFDIGTGAYSDIWEYPLGSGCLWLVWHRDATGGFECSCTASVNLGTDDVPSGISTKIEYDSDGASGRAYLGGTEIWSGHSNHLRNRIEDGSSSGATLLSESGGECGSPCGGCEDGDCDDLENPSLGSLRFRVPLSAPLDGHVDGFLFLDEDSAFWPTPNSFSIKARDDADIDIARQYGSLRMVRSNGPRGRQVSITSIGGGVRLTVTNLFEGIDGKLDHIWEITRSGYAMRLRKISRAGNLMQDETFVLGELEGQTTRIDNISGRTETVSRQGAFTEDPESEIVERRIVSDASGAVFEETETVFRRFGEGHDAVEREVARRRMTPLATNECFAAYWPDGRPLFSWGDDRPCRYAAFDGLGRETNSISYFCHRDALEELGIDFGDGYSSNLSIQSFPFDVSQTVTSYEPLPGDDADPRDRDEPRHIDEYRTGADGEPVLAARTWFVHTRGAEQGWPAHTVATIRAASRNASMSDPANAVSVSTAIDADAPGIPRVLRGKPVMEQDEDGGVTCHVWSPCSFSLENGAPAITAGYTHWLRVATEEFGEETKPIAHVSVIDADTGGEVYSAQRHVASGLDFGWEAHLYDCRARRVATLYADGTSSTNAYSCCRLLWTQGRDGARTLRSATTGHDSLYYAIEEVSLAELPHDDNPGSRIFPYEVQGYADANSAYRTTQFFFDSFGRETNTVVRTCKSPGLATNENWTCAGWRASSSVTYPFGTSDYRVATDQRGGETTTIRTATTEADFTQTIASNKTTTVTSWRNGDSTTLEEWTDGAGASSAATLRWRETRRFAEYAAHGTRAEYAVVSSSDGDCTTNSITFHDFLGRVWRTVTPLSDTAYEYGGATARLLSSSDAISGVAATNLYDDLGEQVGRIVSGVETRADTGYEVVSNTLWRVTAHSMSGGTRSVASATRERLTGLSDQLRGERLTFHNGALVSRSHSSFDAETSILTEVTESATSGTNTVKRKFGRLIETIDSTGRTRHFFDPYGRAFFKTLNNRRVDAYGRNDYGDIEEYAIFRAKVDWLSDLHTYDIFGNRVATTNALGDTTFFAYDAAKRLVATGGATYPLLYAYDAHGRRTGLSTTRDGATWDTTTWAYDHATGLCTNKTYADGSSVSYTYTPDGKPLRTIYPSGRWKENAYDDSRLHVSTGYSDGEIDGFAYDAFGQTVAESNSIASVVYFRDNCGNCTNETIVLAGGPQSPAAAITNTIERAYDAYGRLTQTSLRASMSPREISYSSDGQIAAISNAVAVVEYAYTPDRLDAGYTLTLTNGTVFTRTLVRDAYRRNLILAITNAVNGVPVEALEYAYDALGRSISRNADAFGYNERGEVVFSRGGAESAEDTYSYDDIGNLLLSSVNAVTNLYGANNLNQYSSITNLCASAPPRELSYDLDGNLLTNGVFSYSYDAANRLASVSSNGAVVATFAYDAQGRRVRKIVSHGGTETQRVDYTWDGWLLVKETITDLSTFQPFNSSTEYHWSKDLSGTFQGTGGIGGLLYLKRDGSIYIPYYDAFGNILGYHDAQGNVVASYTYDAFGNIVAQSGTLADFFRHRFSTKYFDPETGLYYYGYRFYSPPLMRWLNRDPIGEDVGLNLYAFCGNSPTKNADLLGERTIVIDILPGIAPENGWGNDNDLATVVRIENRDVVVGGIRKNHGCIQMILVFSPPNSLFFIYYRHAKTPWIKAQEMEHISCHEKHYDSVLDAIYSEYNGKIFSNLEFDKAKESIFFRLEQAATAVKECNNALDAPGGPHGH